MWSILGEAKVWKLELNVMVEGWMLADCWWRRKQGEMSEGLVLEHLFRSVPLQ